MRKQTHVGYLLPGQGNLRGCTCPEMICIVKSLIIFLLLYINLRQQWCRQPPVPFIPILIGTFKFRVDPTGKLKRPFKTVQGQSLENSGLISNRQMFENAGIKWLASCAALIKYINYLIDESNVGNRLRNSRAFRATITVRAKCKHSRQRKRREFMASSFHVHNFAIIK